MLQLPAESESMAVSRLGDNSPQGRVVATLRRCLLGMIRRMCELTDQRGVLERQCEGHA